MDSSPLNASKKSSSVDSLASSSCQEVRVTQTRLFEAIEAGDEGVLLSLLEDEDREEAVRDAILLTKIPNHDGKYRHDPELQDANELLGPSLENLYAIHIACILGEEDIALHLLDFVIRTTLKTGHRMPLNEFISRPCGEGNTVLHLAAFMGMSRLTKKLIETGANVHKKNGRDYKPVDLVDDDETREVFTTVVPTAPARKAPPVNLLRTPSSLSNDGLSRGNISRSDTKNTKCTPELTPNPCPQKKKVSKKRVRFDPTILLLDMCQKGISSENSLEVFKEIVSAVDCSEILSPQKNMSLLHVACSYGQKDLAQILLQQPNVRINQQDLEGWMPLHCAAAEGDLDMMKLLGRCSKVQVPGVFDLYVEDGPVDLAAETFDGESVEDVALDDNGPQVISLLKEMNQTQEKYQISMELTDLDEPTLSSQDTICESKIFEKSRIESKLVHYILPDAIKGPLLDLPDCPTLTSPVQEFPDQTIPCQIFPLEPSVSPKREPPATPTKPDSICLSPGRRLSFGRENVQPSLNGVPSVKLKTPSPQKAQAHQELAKESPADSSPGGFLRDRTVLKLKTPSPQKTQAHQELAKESPTDSSPGGSLRDRIKRLAALGIQ